MKRERERRKKEGGLKKREGQIGNERGGGEGGENLSKPFMYGACTYMYMHVHDSGPVFVQLADIKCDSSGQVYTLFECLLPMHT